VSVETRAAATANASPADREGSTPYAHDPAHHAEAVDLAAGTAGALLPLEVVGLGHSEVSCAGRPVTASQWRGPKSKELFFYLLCHPGWQRRAQIAADVWGDVSSARARSGFHSNANRLRRALYREVLEENEGRYRLNPHVARWFDAEEFGRRCREAFSQLSSDEGVRQAREALELYGGPFLDDLSPDWAQPLRTQLEALYVELVIRLGKACLERGDLAEAERLAHRALDVDPQLPPAQDLLALCHTAAGQMAAAGLIVRRFEDAPDSAPAASPGHTRRGRRAGSGA
jgi:two-component SAPR family response regulator